MIKIRKANPNKPYKGIIYSDTGIGKSTFGALSERPVFIPTEDGQDQLVDRDGNEVDILPKAKTWDALIANVNWLLTTSHNYKTAVLDSVTWAEKLAHAAIIGTSKKTIITVNGGFNAGHREAQTMIVELLTLFDRLREEKDMNIIMIAHATAKEDKDPSATENYNKLTISLQELAAQSVIEWADFLFFAGLVTYVNSDKGEKTGRAFGDGTRTMYTVQTPAVRAKNRYKLPPKMPFTLKLWDELQPYFSKGAAPIDYAAEIALLMNDVKDAELKPKVEEGIKAAGTDRQKQKDIYDRLKEIVKGQ